MHKLYTSLLLFSVLASVLIGQNSAAISQNLLISQVKVGNSATTRLIEVYNNSDLSYDVSGLCVYYSTPKNAIPYNNLGCFNNPNPNIHMFVRARSYILIASLQLGLPADMFLTMGLGTGASGHVYLIDGTGKEIDRVGWGEAENAEGNSPAVVDSAMVIERRKDLATGDLIDTDVNSSDFINSSLRQSYQYMAIDNVFDVCSNIEGIQESVPGGLIISNNNNCNPPDFDVCSNIDGMQIELPSGYDIDEVGDCRLDLCQNIDGLQWALPDGMDLAEGNNCISHDECPNIPNIQNKLPEGYQLDDAGNCNPTLVDICNNVDGAQGILPDGMEFDNENKGSCVVALDKCLNLPDLQQSIPNGFIASTDNVCKLDLLPLKITELLPNAAGNDENNEFIELYNPNKTEVNLTDYLFYVGNDHTHTHIFPNDSTIKAGEYKVFYNKDINFTLVNTKGGVDLFGRDNILIDETIDYDSPKDGMSWSLIDNVWQYTNRPTPGLANEISLVEVLNIAKTEPVALNEQVVKSVLAPCASNQYRSPETNRCRLIVTENNTLTPCKDGQYRSEETNRCRSITSEVAALTACAEGQERNPETNRCRSVSEVLGSNDLKPCAEGQERNPETNRCRNIVSEIPAASFAIEKTTEPSNNGILWWSLAGVGIVAIVYGIWEWRQEIVKLIQKIGLSLHRKK